MSARRSIAFVCAMPKEIRALVDDLSTHSEEQEDAGDPFPIYHISLTDSLGTSRKYPIVESGIGKANAASATLYTIQRFAPSLIVNVGVSGGLYPDAQVGDLCVSTSFRYHDVWCGDGNDKGQVQGMPTIYEADSGTVTQIEECVRQCSISMHSGLLLCGDTFIPESDHLRSLVKEYPHTIAVDMESAAMAQVAYRYHVPIVSLRIVSDTPLTDDFHSEQYLSFWQDREVYGKAFAHVRQLLSSLL